MKEPTNKMQLLVNHMRDATVVTVYGSQFSGDLEATPDRIIVGDYEVTDEDIRRGWIDVDELPDG